MDSEDDHQLKKIWKIMEVFNDFVLNYHSGSGPEDQQIIKEWELFRKTIEQSPTDITHLSKYIN